MSAPALAASLLDDPFYRAITIDFDNNSLARGAVLEQYFDYALREAQRGGRSVTLDDLRVGAAAWVVPDKLQRGLAEATLKTDFLRGVLGARGMSNYRRMVHFMGQIASDVVPPDAWYLSILGIDPAHQGQGLGAELLVPTLKEIDTAGAPCYLETFSARSQGFYERAGFRTLVSQMEPVTNSPYAIMVRGVQTQGRQLLPSVKRPD